MVYKPEFKGQKLSEAIYDRLCRDDWFSELNRGKHRVWYIKDIAVAMGASNSGVSTALKRLGDCISWEEHPFWTQGGYSMEYKIRLTDFTKKEGD